MAFFNRFPFTNFHELNLDWIIEYIKELKETNFVKSINNILADLNGNVTINAADVPGTVRKVNNVSPSTSTGNVNLNAANIPGAVRSVNNTTPDNAGNVNLPQAAGVTSVNGIGADGEGNVALNAADIPHAVISVNSIGADGNGNVALGAADIPYAVTKADVTYNIYSFVSSLGLTAPTTIAAAYNAMNNSTMLICRSVEFESGQTPGVGVVVICKRVQAESYIRFYGRTINIGNYEMYLNSDYSPSNIWTNDFTSGHTLIANSDLNDAPIGVAHAQSGTIAQSISNVPNVANLPGFRVETKLTIAETNNARRVQIIYTNAPIPDIYIRSQTSGGWGAWQKVTTTPV